MPYLTYIGPHDSNPSGLASRGYHLYRRGSAIYQKWGRVIIITGKRPMIIRWKYIVMTKKISCYTVNRAKLELIKQLEKLEKKGYERLGPGVKILPKLKE